MRKKTPVSTQRTKESHKIMAGIGLLAHLQNLKRRILQGNTALLGEFQQMVQYAPVEARMRLLDSLTNAKE